MGEMSHALSLYASPRSNFVSKSYPFSIYLLKPGKDATNSLKTGHSLVDTLAASKLPPNSTLFVLDNERTQPWWKHYFGVDSDLWEVRKGAVLFLRVLDRCFALTFGLVHHNLSDESIEHDFGLRVTLNCVDPKELKSTDTLEPGAARRQRTQMPMGADLTYFDFDRDSSIVKSITGRVSPKHMELFKHVTGASGLSISLDLAPHQLADSCAKLLELYSSDSYKTSFPDLQNIVPVQDPLRLAQLNERLLEAVRTRDESLYLAIPELVDYAAGAHFASFKGAGRSDIYFDVFLGSYEEYLREHGVGLEGLSLEDLSRHKLDLCNANGTSFKHYSIFKCLIYDTTLEDGAHTYHLMEGKWYRVENSYIQKLKDKLDPLWIDLRLPEFRHESEGTYNTAVAEANDGFLCLDETNIAPQGQSQVEPCDLYAVDAGLGVLYHVKRSTLSAQLSHLFSQGANALELLKSDAEALGRFRELVREKVGYPSEAFPETPIETKTFRVVFAMVTHKDINSKSENLPLFSRISLFRALRFFTLMNTECSFGFVRDASVPKAPIPKTRKRRSVIRELVELATTDLA